MLDDRGLKHVYQKDRREVLLVSTAIREIVDRLFRCGTLPHAVQRYCGSRGLLTEIDIFLIYDLAQYRFILQYRSIKKKNHGLTTLFIRLTRFQPTRLTVIA